MIGALRAGARAVLLIAVVAALFPPALATRLLAALERRRGVPPARVRSTAAAARLQAAWARATLAVAGVRLTVEGAEPGEPALYCANHRGYVDVPVLAAAFPGRFVAMREIRDWPLFGWMARSSGTLFLRRERPRELPKANARVAATLASGVSVLLFPEGRAGPGDRLGPLRSPLLQPAAEGRLPCVPVAVEYATPGVPWSPAWTVAWWGGMGLVRHAARLLALPRIEARVRVVGEPLVAADRKLLAAALAERLEGALAPVPLAPEPPDNPWRGLRPDGGRAPEPGAEGGPRAERNTPCTPPAGRRSDG